MSVPAQTSGAFSQSVSELVQEVQRAQSSSRAHDTGVKAPNENFAAIMNTQTSVVHVQPKSDITTHTVLNKLKHEQETVGLSTAVGSTERHENSVLVRVVQDLLNGQDRMTNIMHRVQSGEQFGTTDLIGMQAEVYHYTQELDLSAKVVDKGSNSIKQTMNTQVG